MDRKEGSGTELSYTVPLCNSKSDDMLEKGKHCHMDEREECLRPMAILSL
jgi:hypothetical protein